MAGPNGASGNGHGAPADSADQAIVSALGWMTEKLVDCTDAPSVANSMELKWDVDAGSFPPNYWHWLYLREQYQAKHADSILPRALPTRGPLLSVVVPVYRPALWYFRECVLSVIDQTYQSWELCLCDDGSDDPELTAAMAEFAADDHRIKIMAMEKNGGISRATNKALSAATGELVVLLDHDDVLAPDALAEVALLAMEHDDIDVIYSDEDKLDESERPFMPHFKPDWDPDLLLAYPYFGHVTVVRRELLMRIGGFRSDFDGSQDYDVMLRICHIPKVLYHWRVVAGSAAGDSEAKPWAHVASRRAVEDAIVRRGLDATVEQGPFPGAYHVRQAVKGSPSVSVIIPFRDQAGLTMSCLDSLEKSAGHDLTEIVLIDNGSVEPETKALRKRLAGRTNIRIMDYPGAFNWAAINNAAAATCTSDMLLFLNNDIEATSEGWLNALVELGQRQDVGAVGARLIFPDGKLQHAGVVLGLCGIASHIFVGKPQGVPGYFSWDRVVREYSAVTAACMLVRREVFEEVGGFDEAFAVGFNDVDFCIRLGRAGYRILYTPHAELIHYESVSRGLSGFYRDYQEFLLRWTDLLRQEDPFYNKNLGRLEPWCPLRPPGEDEEWLALVGGLVQPIDGGSLEFDGVAEQPVEKVGPTG
jgi:GT2 family glycosyltransferase